MRYSPLDPRGRLMCHKLYMLALQRQQKSPLPGVKNAQRRKWAVCWLTVLVVWQSSIDRLYQIDSPSCNGLWFAEKESSHGQISCHPHGCGTMFAAENGVVREGGRSHTAPWPPCA